MSESFRGKKKNDYEMEGKKEIMIEMKIRNTRTIQKIRDEENF